MVKARFYNQHIGWYRDFDCYPPRGDPSPLTSRDRGYTGVNYAAVTFSRISASDKVLGAAFCGIMKDSVARIAQAVQALEQPGTVKTMNEEAE